MLRAAELPTTLISSKQFPDFLGQGAGRRQGHGGDIALADVAPEQCLRYVDYEVDIARQDTVQNLTTILLNNNQMQLQRPALYVSGAIAFVDQNVIQSAQNRRDFWRPCGSWTQQKQHRHRRRTRSPSGRFFRTRTIIPGLDSANEVVIGGAGDGLDLAGRIGSYGVRFNVGRDYAMGTGGALRTLVDLAMIELVGKWARVLLPAMSDARSDQPQFSAPDARLV